MFMEFRKAAVLLIAMTVVTGVIYPLIVTSIAQLAFTRKANGSLMNRADHLVGSELIGQYFGTTEYFWGRLSATSGVSYDGAASSGSNYGPLHPALKEAAQARIAALGMGLDAKIPVELVTASGSGLDPHISPAAADYQVSRIAKTREMSEDKLRELIQKHTESRQFGVLGERRVNVLRLNLELDQQLRD